MPYHSIFRPSLFDGQTIVVTGGGSGIGRCTAHELKSLGARLALVGRTQEKLDQVKEELGGDTFTFAGDLRE
jgi:citronellol/citronellal dehydrogenase